MADFFHSFTITLHLDCRHTFWTRPAFPLEWQTAFRKRHVDRTWNSTQPKQQFIGLVSCSDNLAGDVWVRLCGLPNGRDWVFWNEQQIDRLWCRTHCQIVHRSPEFRQMLDLVWTVISSESRICLHRQSISHMSGIPVDLQSRVWTLVYVALGWIP